MWGKGGSTNILIASGDVSTCLYVQILAHQDGMHASYFTQPEDVVEALRTNPQHWTAVFVDMLSPVMMKSGLVDRLQAIRPDIRLVILTSHVTEQVRHTFKQEFLCKMCPECSETKNQHCSFLHKPFYRDFDRVVQSALVGAVRDASGNFVIQG